jgi:hypothetical protein
MALADTAKLLASLDLEDKLSGKLKKAMGNVAAMETGWTKFGQTAERGLSNAAVNITKLGLVAGGFVASQVVFGVKALEDLERITNLTAGVIKSTGGAAGVTAAQVRDLANAQEDLTTVDDKVVQAGENMLLTFTNIGKGVFPQATAAMVNMGVAMNNGSVEGLDLSKTAIQIGKALQDPVKGVTALRKVGVALTDQQTEQVKALVKAGKVEEAQKIILHELAVEFGNAGKAAGQGFGADIRRFGDAVEEAQMALATGFLPVIRETAQWLNTKLRDPKVIAGITEAGKALARYLEQGLAAVQKIPWDGIATAVGTAAGFAKQLLDAFLGMPEWVKTAVITGWGLNKLTGGALRDMAGILAGGLVKGVLGMTAGVVNINAGVVNGAGGVPIAGGAVGQAEGRLGGIIRTAVSFLPAAIAASLAVVLAQELLKGQGQNDATAKGLIGQTQQFVKTASADQLRAALAGVEGQRAAVREAVGGLLFDTGLMGNKAELDQVIDLLRQSLLHQHPGGGGASDVAQVTKEYFRGVSTPFALAVRDFARATDQLIHSNLFGKAAAARTATGSQYSYQVLEKYIKGQGGVTDMQAFVTGQAVTLQAINKLRTPGNEAADLKGARGELKELKAIQRRFLAQGDTKMAAKIGADIKSLQAAIDATTAAVNALPAKLTLKPGTTIVNITNAAGITSTAHIGTGKNARSGALEFASGFLGTVAGAMQMIVGEAGRETVAILRNPRPGTFDVARPQPVHVTVRAELGLRSFDRSTVTTRGLSPNRYQMS